MHLEKFYFVNSPFTLRGCDFELSVSSELVTYTDIRAFNLRIVLIRSHIEKKIESEIISKNNH